MLDFLGSIWWLIVALGILVTFHEFGHYWVARRCGVRVLRFSVGFGKPLWTRLGKDGTEYVIAALPLGGYVKMLDEREADVPDTQLGETFNRKPVSQRIAIVAAGPAFNLLLCLLLLWGMFMVGKDDYQPLVGRTQNIAAEAGLKAGDRILSVAGTPVENWTHIFMALGVHAEDRQPIEILAQQGDGAPRRLTLDLRKLPEDFKAEQVLRSIGALPLQFELPSKVGQVADDSAAADAGLMAGDLIRAIDGQAIEFFNEILPFAQSAGEAQRSLQLLVDRNGQTLLLEATPRPQLEGDAPTGRYLLGVSAPIITAEPDAVLQYGPVDALGAAARETWRMVDTMANMIYRLATGSFRNLSGPISIAQYANETAKAGAQNYIAFLAMLSLSLCIMNLLPIPILDGGHLLYYLIEAIKGAPISEKSLIAGQYVGLVMLGSLMALAFYNDILRVFSS